MKNKQKLLAIIIIILSILGMALALASYLDFFSNDRLILARKKDNTTNIEPKYTFYTELKHRKVETESPKTNNIFLTSFGHSDADMIRYVVEFGVFNSELDARVHLRKAAFLRLPVRINYQQGKYRAQVGPIKEKSAAFNVIDKLKAKRLPARMIQTSE